LVSVVGVQLGTRLGMNLKNEELRILMSIIIMIFGLKFGYSLFVEELKFKIFRKIESQDQFKFFSRFYLSICKYKPNIICINCLLD
jgi:hypothetical protein